MTSPVVFSITKAQRDLLRCLSLPAHRDVFRSDARAFLTLAAQGLVLQNQRGLFSLTKHGQMLAAVLTHAIAYRDKHV